MAPATTASNLPARSWYETFRHLMPFRIREILMVSSAYDAFALEEDGPLTDQLFTRYSELHLSDAPRILHVPTARAAMDLLIEHRFDLVITVAHLEDGDAATLSRQIKERYPALPVVLLIFDEVELQRFPDGRPKTIDRIFLWTGDAQIMIAVIKHIEDARNVAHDTRVAGVQVILVVEDQIRAYSTFLGLLYPELTTHAQSLISDGVNDLHRVRRMRARPKILLATDFEEGMALYRRFRDHMLALITDIRYPRNGVEEAEGGLQLAEMIREASPELPIMFQSSERSAAKRVAALNASLANKKSPRFPLQVREFLRTVLGFGDFVFRLRDGSEIARAGSIYEMEKLLGEVPADSIVHHSVRNDFSVWLKARSMFDLANRIRPKTLEDFDGVEEARQYLIRVLQEARNNEQAGVITDMSAAPSGSENRFVRVGKGSLGGKARSLAFINSLIERHRLRDFPEDLEIRIPKTIVVGTHEFDRFIDQCRITDAMRQGDDRRITQKLLEGTFRTKFLDQLFSAFLALKGPLSVRSSSLLEYSQIGRAHV